MIRMVQPVLTFVWERTPHSLIQSSYQFVQRKRIQMFNRWKRRARHETVWLTVVSRNWKKNWSAYQQNMVSNIQQYWAKRLWNKWHQLCLEAKKRCWEKQWKWQQSNTICTNWIACCQSLVCLDRNWMKKSEMKRWIVQVWNENTKQARQRRVVIFTMERIMIIMQRKRDDFFTSIFLLCTLKMNFYLNFDLWHMSDRIFEIDC